MRQTSNSHSVIQSLFKSFISDSGINENIDRIALQIIEFIQKFDFLQKRLIDALHFTAGIFNLKKLHHVHLQNVCDAPRLCYVCLRY